MDKYQKYIASSYDYKVECVDDQFSRPFNSYLGEESADNFINNMIKERKFCSDIMENKTLTNIEALRLEIVI